MLVLAGCAKRPEPLAGPMPVPQAVVAAPLPGSLFSEAALLALAGDGRAANIGDIVTVRLDERTSASKSARASNERSGSLGLTLPSAGALAEIPDGIVDGSATQQFEGGGEAEQRNALTGEITAIVTQRLGNGLLRIEGTKQVSLTRGRETMTLSGFIRARDIGFDNRISSQRVADARIHYGGSGQIANATREGWLSRFFSLASPF